MADTGLRKRGNKNESGSQPAVVADGSNDSSKQRGSKKDRDCNKPFGKVICFTLGLFVLVPLLFAAVVFRSAYYNFQLGYGDGVELTDEHYVRNRGGETHSEAKMPVDAIEIVAELPSPPGKIAVSDQGRIFFSFHPEHTHPHTTRLAEWLPGTSPKNGKFVPYPSEDFQARFHSLFAVRIANDILWALDYGKHGMYEPVLYMFDLKTNQLKDTYVFDGSVAPLGSLFSDFAVHKSGKHVYISDTSFLGGQPALVVLNFDANRTWCRRVLVNDIDVRAKPFHAVKDGRILRFHEYLPYRPHITSIVVDFDGGSIYFKASGDDKMWRLDTRYLHDLTWTLRPVLHEHMSFHWHAPMSQGLSIDEHGYVFVTDVVNSAVAIINMMVWRDRMWKLIEDPKLLRWPDGLSWGPDGYMYISCSAFDLLLEDRAGPGGVLSHAPFHLLRFKPSNCPNKIATGKGRPGQ